MIDHWQVINNYFERQKANADLLTSYTVTTAGEVYFVIQTTSPRKPYGASLNEAEMQQGNCAEVKLV